MSSLPAYPCREPSLNLEDTFSGFEKRSNKSEVKILVIAQLSENLLIQSDLAEIAEERGAGLACEAVVSKAKDRADSPLCRALGREVALVLT